MNDPSKRIDVNISSLLSLKAELLRKQDEVNKAKEKQKAETFVPKKGSTKDKKEKVEEIPTPDVEEYEDSELLHKSKKVLEAKAKFYDRMAASGGKLNSDDNCLVLFNQKRQDNRPEKCNISSSDNSSDEENDRYSSRDPDEEWVEYTDCLGRTRKCLRKDLEFFKKKDSKLAENIQPRIELNQNAPMWMIDTKGSNSNDKTESRDDMSEMTSVMSKHDQMKMNWEKKEEENVYKENVHYQDVLFDEARTHGVGYYAFSTDEEQRAKQRRALDEMREKTLEEQKEREAQRQHREKIISERVRAAKNRQRARLGLPPIEDEPEPEQQLFDTKEEEKRKKREEKERRKKEKEEKRKEQERKQHIRPWDRNKEGVPPTQDSESDSEGEWNYRPQREPMSQEQWNDCKRDERNPEFAPVPEEEPPKRSFRAQAPYIPHADDNKKESLYFTTKKSPKKREFHRKNYSAFNNDQGIAIVNELEENVDEKVMKRFRGAEIPPPPTFEYYGPTGSGKHSKPPPKSNLEQSIEAGLKYLRDQSDKGILPTKSSWTANADY